MQRILILLASMPILWLSTVLATAATHRVPEQFATVQAAIDEAKDGDVVEVARGVYCEGLSIAGKSVTLVSRFAATHDPEDRRRTILDGGIYGGAELVRRDAAITVGADAGRATRNEGFTIRNGDDGIACAARIDIVGNRFVNNNDAIDYENGGGLCERNLFIGNQDDAVDVDNSSAVVVAGNVIRDCADDGVEIRLHDYHGPPLEVVVRDNVICGSGENGVQIINYPGPSDRRLTVKRNLITHCVAAGIGVMSDGVTLEDYRAAPLEEPLAIVNNTVVDCRVGISCGGGVTLANNLVASCRDAGIKFGVGEISAASNLCWRNAADVVGAAPAPPLSVDPQLDSQYRPSATGPCCNSGAAAIGTVAVLASDEFQGAAPDIGRDER